MHILLSVSKKGHIICTTLQKGIIFVVVISCFFNDTLNTFLLSYIRQESFFCLLLLSFPVLLFVLFFNDTLNTFLSMAISVLEIYLFEIPSCSPTEIKLKEQLT